MSIGGVLRELAGHIHAELQIPASLRSTLAKRWTTTEADLGRGYKYSRKSVKERLEENGINVSIYVSPIYKSATVETFGDKNVGTHTRVMRVGKPATYLLVMDPENTGDLVALREALLKDNFKENEVILYKRTSALLILGEADKLNLVEFGIADFYPKLYALSSSAESQYALRYPLYNAWANDFDVHSPDTSPKKAQVLGVGKTVLGIVNDYASSFTKFEQQAIPTAALGEMTRTALYNKLAADRDQNRLTAEEYNVLADALAAEPVPELPIPQGTSIPYLSPVANPEIREVETLSISRSLAPVGAYSLSADGRDGAKLAADAADLLKYPFNDAGLELLKYWMTLVPKPPAIVTDTAPTRSPSLAGYNVLTDHANNSLLVIVPAGQSDLVTQASLGFLDTVVEGLDIPTKMVELSATIIDIDETNLLEWGTRFAAIGNDEVDARPGFATIGFNSPTSPDDPKTQEKERGLFSRILNPKEGVSLISADAVAGQGLNVGGLIVGSTVKLMATVHAMEEKGDGQVLARPAVVTLDNTEAEVSESTKFYLPSEGVNSGSLSEVTVPLSVSVTPQIIELEPGMPAVSMRVKVSDGNPADQKGLTSFDVGTIRTSAIVLPGQSLLIAGRLRDAQVDSKSRVPIVGRIPVVGLAFRGSSTSRTSQQRMILISTSIVDPRAQRLNHLRNVKNALMDPPKKKKPMRVEDTRKLQPPSIK